MTAKEIESIITFEQFGTDQTSDSTIFKATLTLEYFGRISNVELRSHHDSSQLRGAMLRDSREHIMRKLYDDQRESLYKAIYDLRKANPMDFDEMRKAQNAVLEAALRQPSS